MADIVMLVDTAIAECPVNLMPLIDDTNFKTIEGAVAYNAAGMALRWHFVTVGGAYTVTSVTPTTAGDYDWTDQGDSGVYTIEIPASAGASINNDTEGFGWFTGVATGVLPWRGPVIQFSPENVVNSLVVGSDKLLVDAVEIGSDTQSLADLKDFADTGYDPATHLISEVTAARMGALTDWINGGRLDLILDIIAADTTTDIPALIATAQTDLDAIEAAVITNAAGVDIAADIIAIKAETAAILLDTAEIGAAGAGLTGLGGMSVGMKAEVQTEANDALVANRLDELLAADSDIDGVAPPTVGSVFHELLTKTAGSFTYDQTTDSLEAVRDRGDAAWITATGFATTAEIADMPTVTEFNARTLVAADYTIVSDLGTVQTADHTAGIADLPTVTEFNARTLVAADYTIVSDLGALATAAQVAAVLTTQITESYRANAAAPTLAQFMSEVLAHLGEAAISGTTKTVNKFDHTTPAETFTLDSATTPTTITRTT